MKTLTEQLLRVLYAMKNYPKDMTPEYVADEIVKAVKERDAYITGFSIEGKYTHDVISEVE